MTISTHGPISKQAMINRGASGFLTVAFERYVPIEKLEGLEPVPANNESDDGAFHPGRKIQTPIEVQYDKATDSYTVYAGNHRISQAKANGQRFILAWVEPDPGSKREIGQSAVGIDPDAGLWSAPAPAPTPSSQPSEEFDETPTERYSPDWFDSRLRPSAGGDAVPAPLRALSVSFCTTFHISGLCDPMYVANVAAHDLGVGDGAGRFDSTRAVRPDPGALEALAARLSHSYSTCIAAANADLTPLEVIAQALADTTRPPLRPR